MTNSTKKLCIQEEEEEKAPIQPAKKRSGTLKSQRGWSIEQIEYANASGGISRGSNPVRTRVTALTPVSPLSVWRDTGR